MLDKSEIKNVEKRYLSVRGITWKDRLSSVYLLRQRNVDENLLGSIRKKTNQIWSYGEDW